MDVRIGVTYSAKELEVDLGEKADKDKVQKEITDIIGAGSGVLWLTDKRGRTVGVAAEKIAYVELGADSSERRVGFVG